MRAVGFFEFGGPEVLETVDLPELQPWAAGQVRVRVRAVPVNPAYTSYWTGESAHQVSEAAPPYVAGLEFAGIVDAVALRLG